ncbi:hypothetical protein EV363DRAFT_64127 [Boletus edulis]|nr:hypothetical protein EV363DRAFT_64127 [Boletus edulis]
MSSLFRRGRRLGGSNTLNEAPPQSRTSYKHQAQVSSELYLSQITSTLQVNQRERKTRGRPKSPPTECQFTNRDTWNPDRVLTEFQPAHGGHIKEGRRGRCDETHLPPHPHRRSSFSHFQLKSLACLALISPFVLAWALFILGACERCAPMWMLGYSAAARRSL